MKVGVCVSKVVVRWHKMKSLDVVSQLSGKPVVRK